MKQKSGRKLLSFLLTLAMVVGLVPGMGLTAYADEGTKLTDGGTLSAGTYYLDGDLTLSSNIQVDSGEVIINLNGHTLKGNGNGSVIHIEGGSLTVNGNNGTITGGTGDDFGGYIGGGAVYVINGGNITLNDCTLKDNNTVYGDAFYMKGGSAVVNNTTIEGTNRERFALWLQGNNNPETSFTMNGGSISGFNWGAFIQGKGDLGTSKFTMNGGTINGNKIGVRNEGPNSKIGIKGNAIISDNATHNVELNDIRLSVEGELGENTQIGIYKDSEDEFTNSNPTTYNDPSKFTSDNPDYAVGKHENGQLFLTTGPKVTYKVKNGTWADGSTDDKTETVLSGATPAKVPTGMKAASGYTGGAWDPDPTNTTITGATTFTYTFTAKQPATVTKAPTAKTLTYNGQKQELVNAGSTDYGTLYYAIGEKETAPDFDGKSDSTDKKWSTDIPTGKYVGTYYVWYKVVGDANHSDTIPAGPITVTISPYIPPTPSKSSQPAPTGLEAVDATSDVQADGAITGATDRMEYSADNGKTWTKVPAGATEISGLAPGEYLVRMAETSSYYASQPVKLTVGDKLAAASPTYASLSADDRLQADAIAAALSTDAETAAQMLLYAREQGIGLDTVLLGDAAIKALPTSDEDPAGSSFAKLTARATKRAKKSITLAWKQVEGADGYLIYGNRCGKANKLLKDIKGNGTVKWTQKKLKKGKYYKYMVVAYKEFGEAKMPVAASVYVHTVTKGAKKTVAKSVKINATSLTLGVGETSRLKASEVKAEKKKKLSKHRGIKYEVENPNVVTVAADGTVTAVGEGSTTIYVYAQNGLFKTVTVTVTAAPAVPNSAEEEIAPEDALDIDLAEPETDEALVELDDAVVEEEALEETEE